MVALTPEERRERQQQILDSPPRPYGVEARVIFWLEDRAWGTERTLPKFKARELVARSPYRAWAHHTMTSARTSRTSATNAPIGRCCGTSSRKMSATRVA